MTDVALSVTQAERIDAACDRFEADWRAGRTPRIEDRLAAAFEADRPALLAALLGVELELRGAAGERPDVASLLSRFPGHTAAVDSACRSALGPPGVETVKAEDGTPTASSEHRPPPAGGEPMPGRVGRFEVRAVLGAGAFGRVYRAWDPQLGRDVAVKVPLPDALRTPADRDRFLREARAAARLDHPNVCPIHEVGEQDGTPFLVMAFIPGRSLAAVLREQSGPLPEQSAAQIARKLALALAAAHHKGIIHRDLKPANVLFDAERDEVVVADFGLARGPQVCDARVTQSGAILGTPAYMSPEQARGDGRAVGPSSDVFSLGVILYEMLAGRRPFSGTAAEVIGQILHVEPERPSKLRTGIDPRLEAICLRALAKDPAGRFASMEAFAAALDEYLPPAADSAAATVQKTPTPAPRRRRIVRPVLALSGLLLLGGLIGLGGIIFFARTKSATVRIDVKADLDDRALSFLLDDKPADAEKLKMPVELAVGPHELVVRRGKDLVLRMLFDVKGGRNPGIDIRQIDEPPSKQLTPEEADREFAKWLFSVGARNVDVSAGGGAWVAIRQEADLPEGPFRVLNFDIWGNQNVTDQTVEPILRWADRKQPASMNFYGTLVGDATIRRLVGRKFLKSIGLGATRITADSLPALATRPDLTGLGLHWLRLSDRDLEPLQKLVNLEELFLSDTPITDAGLKHLRSLGKLRNLMLHSTGVTADGLGELRGLPIESLSLEGTQVRGAAGLAKLKGLPRLKDVYLSGLRLGDDDLKPLTECATLEQLILNNNPITDAAVKPLARLPNLRTLWVDDTGLTDAAIDDLGALQTLRRLHVTRTKITPAGLKRLKAALPDCAIVPEP